MSNSWSWFVIILVLLNILAMVWLLMATSSADQPSHEDEAPHEWDGIQELNNPLPRWWYWLFMITIVYSLGYLYLYPGLGNYAGSLGWTQMSQFEEKQTLNRGKQDAFFANYADLSLPELAANQTAMQSGQRLFLNNCATCHGSAGQGAKGFPKLTDDDWLIDGKPETIYNAIANGRQGIMPNLGLSNANVVVLAQYVQSFSGKEVTDFVLEKGPGLFQVCAACHGADGTGNSLLAAPNLTDDIWTHGGRTQDIEYVIANGIQANMPSFSQLLSESEMRLLAAYVLSIQEQPR